MVPARPTIKDVATEAGVSPTTVSRVLNKRGYLSQATVDAVYAAMKRIGYHPNTVARGLRAQTSDEVGVLMPTLADPFYAELSGELENALADRQMRMLFGSTHKDPQREQSYIDLLHASRVAGLITSSHTEVLAKYAHLRLPVVTIDRPRDGVAIPNVACDNFGAAQDIATLFHAGGARRPLLLTSTLDPLNQRQKGFVQWWSEHGVKVPVVPLGFGRPRQDQTREVAEVMDMSLAEGIDAVFCTNDLFAVAVAEWARTRGVDVPGRLRIAGFDGTELIRTLVPWVTTVVQPLDEMARRAVDLVMDFAAADGPTATTPANILIPARIHHGATTQPLRGE